MISSQLYIIIKSLTLHGSINFSYLWNYKLRIIFLLFFEKSKSLNIQFSDVGDARRYYGLRKKCRYVRKCRSSKRCTRVRVRMSVRRTKGYQYKPQYRVRCRPVRKCRRVRVCKNVRQGRMYYGWWLLKPK